MKRIRLLGLALIAMVALGALSASAAMAEEKGNPQILPTPTEAAPAAFTATGGFAELVTTKDSKVECLNVTGSGSFTSERFACLQKL